MSKADIQILVIEDDVMVAEVLMGFLERVSGVQVVDHSETLAKSKQLLKELNVDLVLLDIYLPDGNGIDLLKWIRHNDIDVDIILITADKQLDSIKEARKYGVQDYLVKPFKFDRFEKAITTYSAGLSKLKEMDSVDQMAIDSLFHNENPSEAVDGVNKTYDSILGYLKEQYPAGHTSSEVAEALGISRITARRYLENMERVKAVQLELDYGNVGRPKNKFRYIRK